MLKALNLGTRHTLHHRLVPYIHRVIHPWDRLRGVAHDERVHFRAQANELDYRIPVGLVFEVEHFSGVKISMTTFEVRKVAITNLVKVEGVSEVRARFYFFCQVFHEQVKEERVGVGVKHLNLLTDGVFQMRVKCVPVKKVENFNLIHVKS